MASYHGKSFSARQLFTCIFTTQVLSFYAAQQFAKQIHSPFIYQGRSCWCVCVCLGKVGGWMVEDGFSEEVGEHWGKQIFSLACDSTVKTHSWCWCVLEVSRANISTALQWQSGVVGMLVCVYVMGGVYWAAVLCNTSGFQKNGLPQNNNVFIYKITFFSQRRKLKITL